MKLKALFVATLMVTSMSALADKPMITTDFLDSLHLDGETIKKCSQEMVLAYDGDATEWMVAEAPPVKGKEVKGRKIFHKIWHFGDGSPAATLWLDGTTLDVVQYKDEEGAHDGKEGEKFFADQCRQLRASNQEAFGAE